MKKVEEEATLARFEHPLLAKQRAKVQSIRKALFATKMNLDSENIEYSEIPGRQTEAATAI